MPVAQRPVVDLARRLRKTTTLPERLLWRALRQRPQRLKFRRQHPIGPFVVDFCCLQKRLIVEVDGIVHDMGENNMRDELRTDYLHERGFSVLRVSARRVLDNPHKAAEAIVARAANPLHQPAAGPPPRTGEAWL